MQTKQEIQHILATIGARPDKKLGQNFLIDINLVKFLLEKAAITKSDTVFEIGCGTGTLTEGLGELAGGVVVVEYDKLLSMAVKHRLSDKANITVINGDALNGKNAINSQAIDLLKKSKDALGGRMLLVANLPYNIAASAMMNLILNSPPADAMYVTIQKEVAIRMVSLPGDELYGTLSIIAAATGNVRILKTLKAGVFWPPPKVQSAMVEYVRDEEKIAKISDLSVFKAVVSLFIGHRRKTLAACTKIGDDRLSYVDNWAEIFQGCQIEPTLRAENLLPSDFVLISNSIKKREK